MSALICVAGILMWALGHDEIQLVGFLMFLGGGITFLATR